MKFFKKKCCMHLHTFCSLQHGLLDPAVQGEYDRSSSGFLRIRSIGSRFALLNCLNRRMRGVRGVCGGHFPMGN